MQHFLVKRYFIIIAACFLLLGALIPIASHAVSSAHAASLVQQGEPLTHTMKSKIITNLCYQDGGQLIATLNKGQEIDITAIAKTTAADPDLGTSDQEALSIYEEGFSPFRLIIVNSGSHSFEFKSNQDNLKIRACWALLRTDDDSDYSSSATFMLYHSDTVSYEVETGS